MSERYNRFKSSLNNVENAVLLTEVQKGKLMKVDICELPDTVDEYEGIPYSFPKSISKTSLVAEQDGFVVFIPMNGGE